MHLVAFAALLGNDEQRPPPLAHQVRQHAIAKEPIHHRMVSRAERDHVGLCAKRHLLDAGDRVPVFDHRRNGDRFLRRQLVEQQCERCIEGRGTFWRSVDRLGLYVRESDMPARRDKLTRHVCGAHTARSEVHGHENRLGATHELRAHGEHRRFGVLDDALHCVTHEGTPEKVVLRESEDHELRLQLVRSCYDRGYRGADVNLVPPWWKLAEHMLQSLGIELARERAAYYDDGEYAATLLSASPEELESASGSPALPALDSTPLANPYAPPHSPLPVKRRPLILGDRWLALTAILALLILPLAMALLITLAKWLGRT